MARAFVPSRKKLPPSRSIPSLPLRELRQLLGLVTFYRRFIPSCAHIIQPLTDLLSGPLTPKNRPLTWFDAAISAFCNIKAALLQATLLCHPVQGAPLQLMVDAADVAVGAALQQAVDGVWQPLAFFSKRLRPARDPVQHFRSGIARRLPCGTTFPPPARRPGVPHSH